MCLAGADEIEELMGVVLEGATSDLERAKKLVDASDTLEDNRKVQEAFLLKALGLASRAPKGQATAMAALDRLERLLPDQKAKWRENRLKLTRSIFGSSRTIEQREETGKALIDMLLKTAGERVAAGNTTKALADLQEAKKIASVIKDDRKTDILEQIKAVQARAAIGQKIEDLKKSLAENPGNTKARTDLIMIYLLDLDDPGAAISHLEDDLDEKLKKFVPVAAGLEAGPDTVLQLSEWYKSLADSEPLTSRKLTALNRAKSGYEKFLADEKSKGISQLKAKMSLKKVEEDLKKIYAASGPKLPDGAVLIMTFNRETFTKKGEHAYVKNFSRKSGHGQIRGCKVVRGVAGEALQFDGNDCVSVPHSPFLVYKPTDSFTFSVWVRPAKIGPSWQNIVNKSRESSYWFGLWINPSGLWGFPTASTVGNYLLGPKIAQGAWQHVVAVQDGKAGARAIVINGKVAAKASNASNCIGTGPLWIGSWGSGSEPLTGLVDELAIFNRALTLKEIRILFDMGRRGQSLAR
jgi:hypothetical protein